MKNTHKLYTDVIAKSGSKNEPLEVTANGTYEAPKGTGYSPVRVNVKLEGNPLQDVIDNRDGDRDPSCSYLFYNYQGTSLDSSIKSIDTSKVTNMMSMFQYCNNLISIPMLDTSHTVNMYQMFASCNQLESIPKLNTSSVNNMQGMFQYCSKLTIIPQLDTSKVENMSGMFDNCSKLTTIPKLDTSKVTNMQNMFNRCIFLTSIPDLNTSNVTNMISMFQYCSKLTIVPQLDVSKVTDFRSMFYNCTSLTSIGIYGFTRSIDISSTALGHDAIVAFLNQAGTAYNSSQKITLGSAKLALLSNEEKAIATNKGWTLA